MPRQTLLNLLSIVVLTLPFALIGCAEDDGDIPQRRGSVGKGDLVGSCDTPEGPVCGGWPLDGNCYCDDACEKKGDCCPDKVAVCGSPDPGDENPADEPDDDPGTEHPAQQCPLTGVLCLEHCPNGIPCQHGTYNDETCECEPLNPGDYNCPITGVVCAPSCPHNGIPCQEGSFNPQSCECEPLP